jgi:hypothetical protein
MTIVHQAKYNGGNNMNTRKYLMESTKKSKNNKKIL